MPTLPGPTTYKAAMETANWREWLRNFIDEIEGQIEVGCFHWAVLPKAKSFFMSGVRVHSETACRLHA
jgi:hypothetical protein